MQGYFGKQGCERSECPLGLEEAWKRLGGETKMRPRE